MSNMDEPIKAMGEFRRERGLVEHVLELEDEIARLKAKLERQSPELEDEIAQLKAKLERQSRLGALLLRVSQSADE